MKYRLGKQTLYFYGHVLHRVIALKDIPSRGVKAGDVGGWLEDEHNLSQHGDCWVAEEAKVFGRARVRNNAYVHERARIYDHATVS